MPMNRRTCLHGLGAFLALPYFESQARPPLPTGRAGGPGGLAQRLVCVGNHLGFYPKAFWPTSETAEGEQTTTRDGMADFQFGVSSAPLEKIRDRLTVLQGLDHGVKGGHFAVHSFLSGVLRSEAATMPNGNVTLDQFAAEQIGATTRFPSLTVGDSTGLHGGCQLSWTRTGTRVPPIEGVSSLYQTLFEQTTQADRTAAAKRLAGQKSILDAVRSDSAQFRSHLSGTDQHKFDEYMTAVRDVEKRVQLRRAWLESPKPTAPFPQPMNSNMVEDLPLLYDLIALALQTNSTKVVTLEIGGAFQPTHLGIQGGYHALSHHGKRESHIESLIRLDTYQIEHFARFIEKLASMTDSEGRPLLDTTLVLLGSGMGDANTHTNKNLPLVLAGGGFRHGSLRSFGHDRAGSPPLANLFVSMLQHLGIETDRFGKSTGTLQGLTA